MWKTYRQNHPANRLPVLLLTLVVCIGSSTVAYGQDFFSNFQTAPNLGDFTLFPSPNSVTFTGGFTQTQGNFSLYHSGTKSFMVTQGNTATITFETPAASVTLWLIDQSNSSVLTVRDQNNQVISTFNATTSFVQVNVSPECGKSVGSMTLQNNGNGMAVIDDFGFTAGQAGPTTVLVASFMNGNSDALNSRVYLWNPSTSDGEVCVRAFALPLMNGMAQELTPAPLSLGTLLARSALNVKVAEDILDPLGRRPYKDDGGNLILEFTIQAADVRGSGQVFDKALSIAFGTYPLQEIPATSAGIPTVLAATFVNGNDDALNSRVYLWNPSASEGAVTVRVYTLPIRGGTARELTTGPLPLTTLGARSAVNIKVAEDILEQLGERPYKNDGGNLTLEFTIQAADVQGTVQVFDKGLSIAFGTYPLQ